jgi:hypothetical protein
VRRARKLGTAVLALAVVLAAVYATGAFSSTSASRSADVTVAGDASAFLALEKSEGPNGEFASYGSNGALQVRMGEGSRGVNPGSRTSFQNVFTISNKGSQPVSVWFAGGSKTVTFVGPNGNSIESEGGAVTLRPGGQSLHVGLIVDSRGVQPGKNLLQSVEVRTATDIAGASAPARGGNAGGNANGGSGPLVSIDDGGGPLLRPSDDGPLFSFEGPDGESADDESPTETVSRSLTPLGDVLTQRDGSYTPPVTPVDETSISPGAREDLRGILTYANRGEVEPTVYRILTGPNVAGSYDGSRFIVGRTPAGSSGWIALWVKNDRVVKAEAGGRDKPSTAAPLQDPITLTTPDGRAVKVNPADGSLSVNQSKVEHVEIDQDDPVVQAGMILTVVSPIDGLGPTDEAAAVGIVGKTVVKKAGPYVTAGLATLGSILASDNGETTKQRESEQNGQEQNKQNDRRNRQERKQNDQKGDRGGSDRRRLCGKLAQRCLPPGDLRADGGQDQIEKIKHDAADDGIQYNSWDKWRESLQKARGRPDVSGEDVDAYLGDIETIAKSDDVMDYTSLIGQVQQNQKGEFDETANEANRAAYYAEHGRTVTVEPGSTSKNRIDLKTVDSGGNREYIELKLVSASITFNTANRLIGNTNEKFNKANIDMFDGQKIVEIRLPDPEKSREEIKANIKDAISTRKIAGEIKADMIRIYTGDKNNDPIKISIRNKTMAKKV